MACAKRIEIAGVASLVAGMVACGEHEASPPDAPIPPVVSCRSFGALTRDAAPLQTSAGAAFHPFGVVSDPSVAFENGMYRMWFTSVDWTAGTLFDATDRRMGTAYAESSDGRIWDDRTVVPADPAHKITLSLAPGTWDTEGVETPSIVRGGDGAWLDYYTGDRPDGTYAIGRARSTDGRVWSREDPVLLPVAAWEQPVCIDPPACTQQLGGVLEPAIVIDPVLGRHDLWYAALGTSAGAFTMRIGHAWSTDDGANWTRSPTPVLEPGPPGSWDETLVSHTNVVREPSGGYHLFYQAISVAQQDQCAVEGSCNFYTPGSIGHAFSEDGITWQRESSPILSPDAAGGDGFFVGGPSAVIRDGSLELFYFGIASRDDANMLRSELRRATAPCE